MNQISKLRVVQDEKALLKLQQFIQFVLRFATIQFLWFKSTYLHSNDFACIGNPLGNSSNHLVIDPFCNNIGILNPKTLNFKVNNLETQMYFSQILHWDIHLVNISILFILLLSNSTLQNFMMWVSQITTLLRVSWWINFVSSS